ncbi:MAG: hypothetical protein WB809_05300 [Thermoplasmata archaeon]
MPHVPATSSVLARLLTAAGYRVETRNETVVAVRIRDRRSVVIAPSSRSPVEVEGLFPPDSIHRILVYDEDPGPAARAVAADRGIEIFDPSTLGPALGEILLPAIVGGEEDGPGPPLDAPFALLPEGARIVRPRIGRAEAELLAGVDGPRFTLRLVPYYVAPYRVRPASPYGARSSTLDRMVAVHAVSRQAEVWEDGDRELVATLDLPHQFIAPELAAAEAAGIAMEAIRRHHVIHVDHTEQHGGALVIETRRVPPSTDDVRLGPLQLVYLPHWYAEGHEGRVVLDAVTGRKTVAVPPMG